MGLIDAALARLGYEPRAGRERIEPRFDQPQASQSYENPSTPLSQAGEGIFDWNAAPWGPAVNERLAMTVTTVFRCVSIIAGVTASLPLKVYSLGADGRREQVRNTLFELLQVSPAPETSSYTWRELWMFHLLLWGNHYSIIRWDNAGRLRRFEPVMPWDVSVYRQAGRTLYRCTLESGTTEWVMAEDMLHLRGPGFDGIKGLSRIQAFARNAISMARLLEEQTARVHENSARPSMGVEVPGNISAEGLKRLKAQFNSAYVGRNNAGRPFFHDAGTKITPLQMTPEDLATLESRRFSVAEISRVFGVPLHLLNETDKSTSWGTGLAEQTAAFLLFTLNPDLNRIQDELNLKLTQRTPLFVEFDRGGLLEMDALRQAQAMQTEINAGIRTINEARRLRNLPDVPGGDVPLVNSTLRPLTAAQQEGAGDAA